MLDDRREKAGDRVDPLPVDLAIAYVLEILPAFGRLHDLGLLFCDFKPDNLIRTSGSVKLIDLGGVYRMDDATSPIYGTAGYQAPEIARTGPTVPSDLFTVARTLAVLCTDFRGYRGTYRYTLPPAADVPLFVEYDSCTASSSGRPPLHLRSGSRAPTTWPPSSRGCSGDRGNDPEVTGTGSEHLLHRRDPAGGLSTEVWRSLPVPLVNPDDPDAAVVVTLGAMEPEAVVDAGRAG